MTTYVFVEHDIAARRLVVYLALCLFVALIALGVTARKLFDAQSVNAELRQALVMYERAFVQPTTPRRNSL